jgi:hypothetical protein
VRTLHLGADCGGEQLGRYPFLAHDPSASVEHWPHDAPLPACGNPAPLEEESGLPAVPVGERAVTDAARFRSP